MGSIERCIDAWYRRGGRQFPCRVWCEEAKCSDNKEYVWLRNDSLALLAIYQVGPIRVHLMREATSVAQEDEWNFRYCPEGMGFPNDNGGCE